MTREELAARIYAIHYSRPSIRNRIPQTWKFYITAKQAFKAADHFLKEAERQSAVGQRKAVDLIEQWQKEDEELANPEPPKPEREAREWWIQPFDHITKMTVTRVRETDNPEIYEAEGYIHVREVLK